MSSDAVKRALAAIVRRLARPVELTALYPARVIAQHDDGSLDVQPEHPRLPALARVPMRQSVPGCDVQLAPGARVLVGFEVGADGRGPPRPDPSRPYAALWDAADVVAVSLGAAGGRPVARQADLVTTDELAPGTITLTGVATGIGAFVVTNVLPVSLTGFVLLGAPNVEAA